MSSTRFMEEMLYVFLFTFSYCRSFSLWWPLPLLIFPMRYKMFMFFFQQNWSLSLQLFRCYPSQCASVDIKIKLKERIGFVIVVFYLYRFGQLCYLLPKWVGAKFHPSLHEGVEVRTDRRWTYYIQMILSEPKFLGCIDKQIILSTVFRCSRFT